MLLLEKLLLLLIDVVVLAVFSAVGFGARSLRATCRGDRRGAAALPPKPCLGLLPVDGLARHAFVGPCNVDAMIRCEVLSVDLLCPDELNA